jgi:uncharacterized RDD family membrane protein YckC
MRFFNRITIQTPESVELEFTLAGIGNRAYALLIDYIIWGLTLLVFMYASIFLLFQLSLFKNLRNDSSGLWYLGIQLLIIFAIFVGYFVLFETIWQGQTPGKRFVKIRVICDDGRPIGLQQATIRALIRPFDDLLFIGAFLISLNKLEKRLGDLVAGTLVIQEERGTKATNLTVSDEAKKLADRLEIEADLSQLLPEDFAVIRDYLQRRNGLLPQARTELSRKLAERVKEIIVWENMPSGVTPSLFLEAVYWAYQSTKG